MAASIYQTAAIPMAMEVESSATISAYMPSPENPHKRRASAAHFARPLSFHASALAMLDASVDSMDLSPYFESGCVSFEHMPEELVYLIFTFLHGRDIANGVQKVCRTWRRLALDDQLWLDLLRRSQVEKPGDLSMVAIGENDLRKPAHKSWRWLYQSRNLIIADTKLVGAMTVVGRHETADFVYEGEWSDGKPHGHGRKIWKSAKSENEAKENENEGVALAEGQNVAADAAAPEAAVYANNAAVLGGGQALPKRGSAPAPKRQVALPFYEGEWKDGKEHGRGKRLFEEDHYYIGEWKEGDREGFGFYHWPNKTFYEGEFKEGFRHGHGTYTWSEKAKYVGQWQKGIEHGKGVRTWADGDRYEGDWVHGTRTGYGIYSWPNGSSYEGMWLQCAHEGYGVYQWPDGRTYKGNFSANKKHGLGEYFWPDGAAFAGQWRNGVRHGDGSMVWPDNSRFTGEWAFDRRVDGRYTGTDGRDVTQSVGAGWAKKYDYYFAMPMDMWEQIYLPEINRLIRERKQRATDAVLAQQRTQESAAERAAKGQQDRRPWGTARP